jgi:hypothetical protein
MFEVQKTAGPPHTLTTALLVIAFIFLPAMLLVTPMSVMAFLLTVAGSSLCLTLACVNWNRSLNARVALPNLAMAHQPDFRA